MEERTLVRAVEENVKVMFHNCLVTLKTCDPDRLLCGVPVWRHCYHMLHSCDRWFIDPSDDTEPSFHREGLDRIEESDEAPLSREELLAYHKSVREKILSYLESLTDADLAERPGDGPYSRLSLMTGQIRHFHAHLGNINATVMEDAGKWPRVAGMDGIGRELSEDDLYE